MGNLDTTAGIFVVPYGKEKGAAKAISISLSITALESGACYFIVEYSGG